MRREWDISVEEGEADAVRHRSHDQLSLPIEPDELTKQLDLWANVKFDFDSPENAAGGQLGSLDDEYKAFAYEGEEKPVKRQKYDFEAALVGFGGVDVGGVSSVAGVPGGVTAPAPASALAVDTPHTIDSISALLRETPSAPLLHAVTGGAETHDDEQDNEDRNDEDKIIRRRRFKKLPMPPVQQRDGESYEQAKKRTEKEHRDAEAAAKRELEEDKRRRNTAASARFRVKKKAREAALEQEANQYKGRVEQLEKEVGDLKRENGWLRGLIISSNSRA